MGVAMVGVGNAKKHAKISLIGCGGDGKWPGNQSHPILFSLHRFQG